MSVIPDLKLTDAESCDLHIDSYALTTARGDTKDYAFVLLTQDRERPRTGLHTTFGLTRAAAIELVNFIIKELGQ